MARRLQDWRGGDNSDNSLKLSLIGSYVARTSKLLVVSMGLGRRLLMVHLWLMVASRGLAEDAHELEKKYMHPRSGCTMARWVYDVKSGECASFGRGVLAAQHSNLMREGDSVYVPLDSVTSFVETFLPSLSAKIILLSGKHELIRNSLVGNW